MTSGSFQGQNWQNKNGEVKVDAQNACHDYFFRNGWSLQAQSQSPLSSPAPGSPVVVGEGSGRVVWCKALNKGLPAPKVQTMNERLADVVAEPRFQTLLLGLFGIVTLVLVSADVYGVVSYSVARRTHEIGIRMALGAPPQAVMKLIIGQGMKLAGCGIARGLLGAWTLTRLLRTLLFGVSATDALSFGLAALLLAGVVLLACYLPARRASQVDPLIALSYE